MVVRDCLDEISPTVVVNLGTVIDYALTAWWNLMLVLKVLHSQQFHDA